MAETNDERLWRIARKRAEFRKSLYSYVVVNLFMWLIWWFTSGRITGLTGTPWPVWVMLGMGFSIALKYFDAYKGSKSDLTDEEYDRIKRERNGL